jgi:hypothetical protein
MSEKRTYYRVGLRDIGNKKVSSLDVYAESPKHAEEIVISAAIKERQLAWLASGVRLVVSRWQV